jgi:hypothetical protein
MITNGESGGMKKEIIVANFRLLFRYLIGGTVKHIDSVFGPSECKRNALNN